MKATKKSKPPICKAVRELRDALGLSQMALAVKMGWHATTVAKYETTDAPGEDALWKLARLAGDNGRKDLSDKFARAAFTHFTFRVPIEGGLADRMSEALFILIRPETDPGRTALLALLERETPKPKGKK